MITTDHIRKLIEEKKVTLGTTATTRAIRADRIKVIVIASNAAASTRASLMRATAMTAVTIDELSIPNDELGTMCKKPFAISVLGIRK